MALDRLRVLLNIILLFQRSFS